MRSKIFPDKPQRVKTTAEKWLTVVPQGRNEYRLFEEGAYAGRILFDASDFWIYDGDYLRVAEQEDIAAFISNYHAQMHQLMSTLEKRISVQRTNSNDADFRLLTAELDQDLRERNGDVMDLYDEHNVIQHTDNVVLGYIDGEIAGCGCFKEAFNDAAEIKRMYVRKGFRGNGLSSTMLQELEQMAIEQGYTYTILETGNKQVEAQGLYHRAGYSIMPNYGPYADLPDSICFKKRLS